MRIPDEIICKTCHKFFCCAKCRHKHEIKAHAIFVQRSITTADNKVDSAPIYLFCPICEGKPLPLYKEMYDEMLDHVEKNHMPLHCKKCDKLYTKVGDLKEFSKCLHMSVSSNGVQECSANFDRTNGTDASKVTVAKAPNTHTTISTQTSPMRQNGNDDFENMLSTVNVHWKAKNKVMHEEFISDSVSSIKNISSINNSSIRRSIGVDAGAKGSLVRSTSTPVHAEMIFAKPKEQAFNASGGQVSSIYNSGCESYNSPAIINTNGTPSKQPLDNMNRYLKVGGRAKMSTVTPLRQVMSKSIQKAFAEHGLPLASGRGVVYNRKKMFDSIDTSALELPSSNGAMVAIGGGSRSPLDLRLSPAVRRTRNKICDSDFTAAASSIIPRTTQTPQIRREVLLSSQKLTTESIVITRTQHLARVESTTSSATNSSSSLKSIQTDISSTATDQSSSSASSGNGSSVYKTCHSVEIITSTELSQVNIHQNDGGFSSTVVDNIEKGIDQLRPLQQVAGLSMAPITPITRIPGAVIHKKLIKFETPKVDVSNNATENCKRSPGEVFFTPEAITPVRKSSLRRGSTRKGDAEDEMQIVPRNLNVRLSPMRRPSIRDCAQSAVFSRVENLSDDNYTEDFDDEDFSLHKKSKAVKQQDKQQEKPLQTKPPPAAGAVGRTWSFSSIMNSVMSLRGKEKEKEQSNSTDIDINSNSIIKRCASIAGSLVRSKPLVNEEQLNSLKRKRTYTTDNQYVSLCNQDYNYTVDTLPTSPNADCSTSVKRLRIQGRKPIERMRINS